MISDSRGFDVVVALEALAIAEKLAALDGGNAQAQSGLAWVRGQIAALTK